MQDKKVKDRSEREFQNDLLYACMHTFILPNIGQLIAVLSS